MNSLKNLPDAITLHQFVEILDFDQQPKKLRDGGITVFPTGRQIASHGNFTRTQIPKLSNDNYLFLLFDESNALIKTLITTFRKKNSLDQNAEKAAGITKRIFELSRPTQRIALARFDNNAAIPTEFDIKLITTLRLGFRLFSIMLEDFVLFNDYQFFSSRNWALQSKIENPFELFY